MTMTRQPTAITVWSTAAKYTISRLTPMNPPPKSLRPAMAKSTAMPKCCSILMTTPCGYNSFSDAALANHVCYTGHERIPCGVAVPAACAWEVAFSSRQVVLPALATAEFGQVSRKRLHPHRLRRAFRNHELVSNSAGDPVDNAVLGNLWRPAAQRRDPDGRQPVAAVYLRGSFLFRHRGPRPRPLAPPQW